MKRITLKDRAVLFVSKRLTGLFVLTTRFGKQTYAKRAIQALWKASR